MFKDLIGWTKSTGKFLVRNNLTASLICVYLIIPAIAWLSARLLGLNQGTVLISLFTGMVIGLGIGLWFGWKWHSRKIRAALGGIRNVVIGKFDQDLQYLRQSQHIDMKGITFHALNSFRGPLEEAFQKGATIQVLLLDTNCASFKEHAKKLAERREVGLIVESEQAVEAIEEIKRKHKGQAGIGRISYRYYNSVPYGGFILTETIGRSWPYLHYEHPENTPTYLIEPESVPESVVGQALRKEFDTIWNKARR